jgi:type I protein arginine methyltransferase
MPDGYSLYAFGNMIGDLARFHAYSQAIAKAVRPGDVVLDIGCGPAVFAMLAARAGARRVFAVETDDIIDFARQLAAANGLADRIEFLQCDSRKLELPELANVIVSDIRGALPFYDGGIASIEDARRRFLTPAGILIPQQDTLKAALVDASDFYSRLISPWKTSAPGLALSAALPPLLNDCYSSQFNPDQLVSQAESFCVLDYANGAVDRACAELRFTASRSTIAHGICVWYETRLFGEIGYSTAPGAIDSVYPHTFLPWLAPIALEGGEQVGIGIRADLIGSRYVWQWNTSIPANAVHPAVDFRQSTFHGARFSPRFLRSRRLDFAPELSAEGQADLFLLRSMNGQSSLQQIAESAAARFPQVFPTSQAAFERAASLAERLSG